MTQTPAQQAGNVAARLADLILSARTEAIDGASINALELVTEARKLLDELAEHVAVNARRQGHPWEVVAQAAGISKQAAHKKWNAAEWRNLGAEVRAERPAVEQVPGQLDLIQAAETFATEQQRRRQRVVVIPCSRAKLGRRAPAHKLYTGQQFKLSLEAAQMLAHRYDATIVILSARHGLVELGTMLEPYDQKMGDPGEVTAETIADQLRALNAVQVLTLTPRAYTAKVQQAGRLAGVQVDDQLDGAGGIGEQRAMLAAIKRGKV